MTYPEEEYRIIPDPKSPEKWCVELRGKKYRGILFSYGSFEFKQPEGDGPLRLKFEHEAIYIPEELRKQEINEEEKRDLIQLLGDILVDILNENLGSGSGTVKDDKFVLEIKKDLNNE